MDQTIRQLWAQSYDVGIDWVTEVAVKLPAAVVAELIGVPQHRRDHLLTWAFASSAILDGMVTPDELDDAVTSVGQFMTFLDEELHRARVVLPPTVVGDLARLVNNSDIDHDVATHILVQLIVAGMSATWAPWRGLSANTPSTSRPCVTIRPGGMSSSKKSSG